MQTKTYFASNVPAALEAARRELGDDAMLVNSKPASDAARPFGRLEVTFAYEAKQLAPLVAPQVTSALFAKLGESRRSLPEKPDSEKPKSELDEIRQQISALKRAVALPGSVHGSKVFEAPRSPVVDQLVQSGLGVDLAQELGAAGSSADLARELAARIPVAEFPVAKPGEGKTIALVGPPGRGKTTTLVKIAVRFGLANRIPVKIYMAGAHGVGCEDQLARYASVLGVPFQPCETLESLTLALNGDMWKGLALIDTPGLSPMDVIEAGELARFFKRRPEIEKHLVLRADARSADISNVITRFSPMEVSRLLFTGLDEALSLGAMADGLIRSRIPAALAGTGQRIPEDIETVSAAWVARLLDRNNVDRNNVDRNNVDLPAALGRQNAAAAVAA